MRLSELKEDLQKGHADEFWNLLAVHQAFQSVLKEAVQYFGGSCFPIASKCCRTVLVTSTSFWVGNKEEYLMDQLVSFSLSLKKVLGPARGVRMR